MSNSMNWTEEELATFPGWDNIRNLKGFIAGLSFIIEKASKNECSPGDLEKEMLQLGMSTEHARELSEVYSAVCEDLHDALVKKFPRGWYNNISSTYIVVLIVYFRTIALFGRCFPSTCGKYSS